MNVPATPNQPKVIDPNVRMAPKKIKQHREIPEGAENLVRQFLFGPTFSGLVKYPGKYGNRSKR
jgi:hypothetical protein